MVSIFRKSIRCVGMIAVAVACMSNAQVSRASLLKANAPIQQAGITQDLVFVRTSGGHFQNVTPSLYTYQGQTFCVCDGETLCIVPNYDAGTVSDTAGNLIGYTVKDSDTP